MSFYKETELYENHQKNIAQIFAKNKETQFIKDLRNYQMHYKVIFPWLSKMTCVRLNIIPNKKYDLLPIEGREHYLEYHRNEIFKA